MLFKKRLLLCALALMVTVALAACGQQSPNVSASAQSSAKTPLGPATVSKLEIIGYGPTHTKAREGFNLQANGESALWVRLNQSLSGYEVTIKLNNTPLNAATSGNMVTAIVPAALYAGPGTFSLRVIARKGTQSVRSNDVKFTVE